MLRRHRRPCFLPVLSSRFKIDFKTLSRNWHIHPLSVEEACTCESNKLLQEGIGCVDSWVVFCEEQDKLANKFRAICQSRRKRWNSGGATLAAGGSKQLISSSGY